MISRIKFLLIILPICFGNILAEAWTPFRWNIIPEIAGIFQTNYAVCGIDGGFFLTGIHANPIYGFQVSGFFNATGKKFCGLQLTSVCNWNSGQFYGVQVAAVNINELSLYGAQLGLISGGSGYFHGIQFGAILTSGSSKTYGLQLSAIINYAGKINGCQLGLLNISKETRGIQIGIVNICNDLKGIQIGLINIIKNSKLPLMIGINAYF